MTNAPLIRTTLLVTVLIAFGLVATGRTPAAEPRSPVIQLVGSDASSQFFPLGVGKSVVIDLPRDIKDVLVADPSIANIVMRTSRRAYMIGTKVGQTNVFFFDADGRQIAGLDIAVTRDLNGIQAALKRALPHADIKVEGVGEHGVMLTGVVANPAESQLASELASKLLKSPAALVGSSNTTANASGGSSTSSSTTSSGSDGPSGVLNALTILGRDQVMLKVTVAEVQREVIKQLGVNLSGSAGFGSTVINFNNVTPFSINGPLNNSNIAGTFKSVTATLRAMERAGVIRTLAEPTLTAISGETANFIAGGEFPVGTGTSCSGTGTTQICVQQITFKKFGVSLAFTPVVLSEGRISLRVKTEVSELSIENAVAGIPGLTTRSVDTTLEIPSGGSLAMAGMIQEQTKQQINGLPGLMQVPILGTLFKSRDYINRQSELAVLVTPYIVRAVARKDLSRPDDGFADASDPATVLLGRLNRIYGVARNADPKSGYRGNYGFILD